MFANAIPFSRSALVNGLLAGAAFATAGAAVYASDALPPVKYPWSHHGALSSYDAAALRRGFEVYRQVCSTCHSLKAIHYRNLVGATHTEEQAKALARSIEVTDGPNDAGEMFQRPGKLNDELPSPYANEQAARAANNGAYPPDLSLIIKARPGGEDYIYSLLMGYHEVPHGLQLRSGLYYNVYFPGNAIAMTPPIHTTGQVEYEDGSQPTPSQMAKDVTEFLCWASEPEHDARKKQGAKLFVALSVLSLFAGYQKRFRWSTLKTQKITYPSQH